MTYVARKVHMTPAFSHLSHNLFEYLNTDYIVRTESQTLQNICFKCVLAKSCFSQSLAQRSMVITAPIIVGISQLKNSVTNEFPDSSTLSFPSPYIWKCLTRNTVFTVLVHAREAGPKGKLSNTFDWWLRPSGRKVTVSPFLQQA